MNRQSAAAKDLLDPNHPMRLAARRTIARRLRAETDTPMVFLLAAMLDMAATGRDDALWLSTHRLAMQLADARRGR